MSTATATGYRLTLPAGWYRIPTGGDAEEAISRVIDAVARSASDRSAVDVRRAWGDRLPKLLAAFEASGALDLYLFASALHGHAVGMQFSVSVVYLGGAIAWSDDDLRTVFVPEGADHEVLQSRAGEVLRVTERGARAVRRVRETAADVFGADPSLAAEAAESEAAAQAVAAIMEADDVEIPFTRLSHLAALPDAPGAFLLIASEVEDSPVAAAELAHIDLIASTLEWTR